MQWDNTEYAGFSNAEPWIPIPIKGRAISVSTQMSDSDSIYQYYKKLIRIRKENKAISEGNISFLHEDNNSIFAFKRKTDNQEILVICNWKGEVLDAKIQGTYHTMLGNYKDAKNEIVDSIKLRPYECYVLEKIFKLQS